ncbi:MAG: fatty acid desaturase [Aestuariivita sp.]|nr:fatty acid desaturase [Aestuariivita sp.]MCY4346459.1 fatty acid desaturase [Aestuariivita sp.]
MSDSSTLLKPVSGDSSPAGVGYDHVTFFSALPYFLSILIFPFIIASASLGNWWLAGPFIFLWIIDYFDAALGTDERNFDPHDSSSQIFWYNLAVWLWVALYPFALIFSLCQVFWADHLALWEAILVILALGGMARLTLNVGHDMMHRGTVLERRIGEIVMASVSFPQEVTEHVCVHHAHIGTPKDAVSAYKGQSFWNYLPQSVFRSYHDTWAFERDRLERRGLSVWHRSNPVWRYLSETFLWYGLAYLIGGMLGVLVFLSICMMGILQVRMVDYIQHYGLQRVKLSNGRYERVAPRHSWSIAFKLTNWFYFNAQRHADHHMAASRLYPLLQYSGPDEAPQLPGSYSELGGLVFFPKRWFKRMNPLVDQWREKFYPEIQNWEAYDSVSYRAKPDAFEVIDEIYRLSPPLAKWINRNPELLDEANKAEFTDLDLPRGFGPDPQFEALARRGLARVYWTHELQVDDMQLAIIEDPARSASEVIDCARTWSSQKTFQICLHILRGNLSPLEASVALSNILEASLRVTLQAATADANYRHRNAVAVALTTQNSYGFSLWQSSLSPVFFYQDGVRKSKALSAEKLLDALIELTHRNVLFTECDRDTQPQILYQSLGTNGDMTFDGVNCEPCDMFDARTIFSFPKTDIAEHFGKAKIELSRESMACEIIQSRLEKAFDVDSGVDRLSFDRCAKLSQNFAQIARLLQIKCAEEFSDILGQTPIDTFTMACKHGVINSDTASRWVSDAEFSANLTGILAMIVGTDDVCSVTDEQQILIAQASDMSDFDKVNSRLEEIEKTWHTRVEGLFD